MASVLWRPLPVFMLTIRQFFGGKSVWVVTVLAFLPALYVTWFRIKPPTETADGAAFQPGVTVLAVPG